MLAGWLGWWNGLGMPCARSTSLLTDQVSENRDRAQICYGREPKGWLRPQICQLKALFQTFDYKLFGRLDH